MLEPAERCLGGLVEARELLLRLLTELLLAELAELLILLLLRGAEELVLLLRLCLAHTIIGYKWLTLSGLEWLYRLRPHLNVVQG